MRSACMCIDCTSALKDARSRKCVFAHRGIRRCGSISWLDQRKMSGQSDGLAQCGNVWSDRFSQMQNKSYMYTAPGRSWHMGWSNNVNQPAMLFVHRNVTISNRNFTLGQTNRQTDRASRISLLHWSSMEEKKCNYFLIDNDSHAAVQCCLILSLP